MIEEDFIVLKNIHEDFVGYRSLQPWTYTYEACCRNKSWGKRQSWRGSHWWSPYTWIMPRGLCHIFASLSCNLSLSFDPWGYIFFSVLGCRWEGNSKWFLLSCVQHHCVIYVPMLLSGSHQSRVWESDVRNLTLNNDNKEFVFD